MNHIKNIIETSSVLSFESDLMIKKFDMWIEYIEPKFNKKFPKWAYRYEYESLYDIDVKNWLKKERKIFDKKFVFQIFLINNDDEILDNNLNWNDCILNIESEYALFSSLQECKEYQYSSLGIITFLNK